MKNVLDTSRSVTLFTGDEMDLLKLFDSKSRQLFWQRLDASHCSGGAPATLIEANQAYFTVRLCEMFLASARKLWRQIYPMVYGFTSSGTTDYHAVASPGQLQDLGNANLDRLDNLNLKLCGPLPYQGGEVAILLGLYAVPGNDASKALIDVVSRFAALDPGFAGGAISLSNLIKGAIESILGLDQATLHLGIRDSYNPASRPLTGGYFAGIAAPDQTIDATHLWVVNGRLMKGADAASAVSYSDHDYMLVAIERSETREDWEQLSELQDLRNKFSNLSGDSQFSVEEKRARLATLWPTFVQALSDSPNLTNPDRERVAGLAAASLLAKLKAQEETNPFLKAA